MAEEIHEIMRVLQLQTYDEDQSELDNLTVLKKLSNTIHNKIPPANDWLGVSYQKGCKAVCNSLKFSGSVGL